MTLETLTIGLQGGLAGVVTFDMSLGISLPTGALAVLGEGVAASQGAPVRSEQYDRTFGVYLSAGFGAGLSLGASGGLEVGFWESKPLEVAGPFWGIVCAAGCGYGLGIGFFFARPSNEFIGFQVVGLVGIEFDLHWMTGETALITHSAPVQAGQAFA